MEALNTSSAFHRLFHSVRKPVSNTAFLQGSRSISYQQLDRWISDYVNELYRLGLKPGDRVAQWTEPSIESVVALLGHHRAGLIHVPVNSRYGIQEIQHILNDCQAKLWLGDSSLLDSNVGKGVATANDHLLTRSLDAIIHPPDDLLQRNSPINRSDAQDLRACDLPDGEEQIPPVRSTALIIYTSGTTGQSKGVELSYEAIVDGIFALTDLWQWTSHDRLALALPLFHVHGLAIGIYGTLLHGMSALILPRFSPSAVVDAIAHKNCSIFMGVPTMYRSLVEHLTQYDQDAQALSRARLFTSGSAALPADLHCQFEQFTGHKILERYGMTETLLSLSNPYVGERIPGSVGMPVPGYAAKIVDDDGQECLTNQAGNLLIRGPGMMSGYWNQTSASDEVMRDGWLQTGDIAEVDNKGYYRILGRRSQDIIKSGGFKIAAREIEEVLLQHHSVAEVAIFPFPDPHWGERIAAAVVPTTPPIIDHDEPWFRELADFVSQILAAYKRPTRFVRMNKLPRNSLGKLQKHRIREQISRGQLILLSTKAK